MHTTHGTYFGWQPVDRAAFGLIYGAIVHSGWLPIDGALFAGGLGSALAFLKFAIH
jgi:hypothetical protein